MKDEIIPFLVVRDEAGEIYALTDEVLAAARVTGARRAAIEAALGDVQGFFTPVPIPRIANAPLLSDGGTSDLSAIRLMLPRTLLEAKPAIGPRPGV